MIVYSLTDKLDDILCRITQVQTAEMIFEYRTPNIQSANFRDVYMCGSDFVDCIEQNKVILVKQFEHPQYVSTPLADIYLRRDHNYVFSQVDSLILLSQIQRVFG